MLYASGFERAGELGNPPRHGALAGPPAAAGAEPVLIRTGWLRGRQAAMAGW
jgi:hypothetical protein